MSEGAEDAYVGFLSSRLPRLNRAAYLLCGDRDRAEDIVQATALNLFLKWRQVRAADNIDGYLYRMLVREFLRQRRARWARVLLIDRLPDRPVAPTEDVENRDAVLAALAVLSAGQRAVIVARFFSDLSVAETAAALNCSQGNVKSQTARGLATLRKRMSTDTVNGSLR